MEITARGVTGRTGVVAVVWLIETEFDIVIVLFQQMVVKVVKVSVHGNKENPKHLSLVQVQ